MNASRSAQLGGLARDLGAGATGPSRSLETVRFFAGRSLSLVDSALTRFGVGFAGSAELFAVGSFIGGGSACPPRALAMRRLLSVMATNPTACTLFRDSDC